jgi:hypothetical protein
MNAIAKMRNAAPTAWVLCLAVTLAGPLLSAPPARAASAALAASREPADIMKAIYDDAVRGETLDWLGAGQRSRYLSRSLTALWARSDAKKPAYGDEGPIDFDITEDTNGAELKTFDIVVREQTRHRAVVDVTLGYSVPDPEGQHVVSYDFVQESGRWKVDEIHTRIFSLRSRLSGWLKEK